MLDGSLRPRAGASAALLAELAAARLRDWIGQEIDRGRPFLFLPVAFGLGILAYFAAPDEPTLWAPAGLCLVLAALAWRWRERYAAFLTAATACALSAGFATAALRTQIVTHPVLGTETRTLRIKAWVEQVERREAGDRLTLMLVAAEPAPPVLPERIRITTRSRTGLVPGQGIAFAARLRPPADPAGPGLYDFARDAYFTGIGATGFVFGTVKGEDLGEAPRAIRARAALEAIRNAMSERIRAAIPGQSGAIADALVTGKRDGISEGLNEAMRQAGLYHILSISGFHMALVAALVFAIVRGGLALMPWLALRYRVKAWAALVALVVATLYLVLSGAEVATQRSWIMIALVLTGVALDRGALTLRTLAIAALVVLILAPESLLGPSFQMSFAATLALVSGYTALRPFAEWHAGPNFGPGRALLAVTNGVAGLAASSFVASLATTPFAAYHFNTVQFYGVPGNLLGAPIIEFIVMPLEILALLLWPFGWDKPVWVLVGHGIALFIRIAEWVASWPGGKLTVPSFSPAALGLITLGIILPGLLSTPLRLLGLPFLALGLGLSSAGEKPSILIDAEGQTIAVRGIDGRLRAASPRANAFAIQRWLAAEGDDRRADHASLRDSVRCDRLGCAMPLPEGGRIAVPRDGEAIADDCREARVLVTRLPVPDTCAAQVIDLRALSHTGAVRLYGDATGYRIETTRPSSGTRPWFRPRTEVALPLFRPVGRPAEAVPAEDEETAELPQ